MPVAAAQKFDAPSADFENGVFLGPLAHFTVNGPYRVAGRQLSFDVSHANVGVGPWRASFALPNRPATPIAERDAQ